ncbi:methyltransferase [Loa loa]|uniref:18S rRNA (guanine-N(7))-methyltransferase n=1 Tax=Loa loa TaxID=7209 RepID=A0A1I7W5M8_LOALO|nr:methyltransferase [Loa loa]EFO23430.1 methyltransferase [Loa loa]
MSRPEFTGPPELYYNDVQAAKYSENSHIVEIQRHMAERAIELLALPDDDVSRLLLDVGCGSGLSGEVITEKGHNWIGVDISEAMLKVAIDDREIDGDVILKDIGDGLPFRPGTFDGAISISAIQWLCHANNREQSPQKRLLHFFQSLYACMGRGTRAVFQFYPETVSQTELITTHATKAGFTGGVVIDFPNSTKAKKVYLVLMVGGMQHLPKALIEEQERDQVSNTGRRSWKSDKRGRRKLLKRSREWIEAKKDRARKHGKEVCISSKYTGRKRRRFT